MKNLKKTNRLALLGGEPLNPNPLPKYNTIDHEEKSAVMRVLESGELSGFVASNGEGFYGGKEVQSFEKEFSEYFGVGYSVAVNSATSALHCAIAALGVGPGDEVIVPPYTMSASATCVLFAGGSPVFCDIDEDIFCIKPELIESLISKNTKGIVAVNLFGHPAKLFELRKIAEKNGLFLVEDNAQAPGAQIEGKFTGTIGDVGVFSFNRHKTIQSGEGGVAICNNKKLALRMQLVRNHGEVVVSGLDLKEPEDIYNTAGLNYRMTEMEAAVARCQLKKLDSLNDKRINLANYLTRSLNQINGFIPPKVLKNNKHVYYFYPIRYCESTVGIPRDLFSKAVEAEGFTLRSGYIKPIYMEPLYQKKICFGLNGFPFSANENPDNLQYKKGICPNVEKLQNSDLFITNITYPPLDNSYMQLFIDAILKVIDNKNDLLNHAS
jgi:dTDP-4-amino-4,6-dideoxygalactose transaminase